MNDEMKRILSRFFLASVIIACLTLLGAGTITAKQRSEYNSYYTRYAMLTLKAGEDKIDLSVDEKKYSLDLSFLKKLGNYSDSLYFTPVSSLLFLGECIFDIFSL